MADILEAAEAAGVRIEQLWQIPDSEDGHFDPANDPKAVFGPPQDRVSLPLSVKSTGPERQLVGCRAVEPILS